MELRVCQWCQGPVPIRVKSCPRCGTPAEAGGRQESSAGQKSPAGRDQNHPLVTIVISYLVIAIGVYVVIEAGAQGNSYLLLPAVGLALFGICGLVSAEQDPAAH
jgi:hypothetical protein